MKAKLCIFFLFPIIAIGCIGKQNHSMVIGSADSIIGIVITDKGERNTTIPIIAHTTDGVWEIGVPVCYLNGQGDTIIPLGKYQFGTSDTINHIGFLLKDWEWIVVDNKGKELFRPFIYDNSPDYVEEGFFRVVDNKGLIGFADIFGNIKIIPQFNFAFPFRDGKAKVTYNGVSKEVLDSNSEYHFWKSGDWFYITKKGENLPPSS